MQIRLVGNNNDLQSSPTRSVYGLKENPTKRRYIFTIPLDAWLLEVVPNADDDEKTRDDAVFLRPWQDFKLASPGVGQSLATLMGDAPNVLSQIVVNVSPFIQCLGHPEFSVTTRDEKKVEKSSLLPLLPQQEVTESLTVWVNGENEATVTQLNVEFSYGSLGFPNVVVPNTYQIKFTGTINNKMIGSAVETKLANGEPSQALGMLIGLEPQRDNEYKGWVLPAENIP